MKNQNLIVSRERLDDHKYMVFISIHSLCRLKHELKGISNCPLSIVFVFDFVPVPDMVTKYNKGMGGVDLLDSMVATYRIPIRS